MSRFFVTCSGQAKTGASRRGGVKSGVEAHARGWNIGARVEVLADPQDESRDLVRVFRTTGSNARGHSVLIAEFREDRGGEPGSPDIIHGQAGEGVKA